MPNEGILLSTLPLQEALSSAEIENVITTQDALYKHQLQTNTTDPITKEVAQYTDALQFGYQKVKKQNALTLTSLLKFRKPWKVTVPILEKHPARFLRMKERGKSYLNHFLLKNTRLHVSVRTFHQR